MGVRIFIACLLLAGLAACGGGGVETEGPEPAPLPLPTTAEMVDPSGSNAEPAAGTPEPASPDSPRVGGSGLPPTYTPSAAELVSGVPTASGGVSAAGGVAQSGRAGGGRTHVVVEGETLGTIAARYGVPLDDLIAANRSDLPDIDLIYPGQVLILPVP